MNLDENTKWIIEKAVVVGVALIGLLGSGKLLGGRKGPENALSAASGPDWSALVTEQREVISDLKERLAELEDAVARKDRFIIQLLHDAQELQRTINALEHDLNRPLTEWEIKLTEADAPAA